MHSINSMSRYMSMRPKYIRSVVPDVIHIEKSKVGNIRCCIVKEL